MLGRYYYLDLHCPFTDMPQTTTAVPTTTIGQRAQPPPTPTTTIGQWTQPPPIPTTTIGQRTQRPPTPTTTIGQWTQPLPIRTSSFPRPEVLCSTQHMNVALPPVPVSHLVVKGRCSWNWFYNEALGSQRLNIM